MFNYTKSELATKANEMNFVRDALEKVLLLADILNYLNSNPITKNPLALKGGTAINLTIFILPRLSVDIDLDYCHNNRFSHHCYRLNFMLYYSYAKR